MLPILHNAAEVALSTIPRCFNARDLHSQQVEGILTKGLEVVYSVMLQNRKWEGRRVQQFMHQLPGMWKLMHSIQILRGLLGSGEKSMILMGASKRG